MDRAAVTAKMKNARRSDLSDYSLKCKRSSTVDFSDESDCPFALI
ncbi:MAG: hypothetical protein ACU0DW_04395 [Shimia sp.]